MKVSVHSGAIDTKTIENFDVIVLTDFYDKAKLIELSDFAHDHGKGFILAGGLGLYGFCFVDYGEKHPVVDPNGE